MKRNFIILLLSSLFFMTACRPSISMNSLNEKTPDIISKPTKTLISKETVAELPKNTWIKTDPEEKVEVKLEEDTVVTLVPLPETPEIKSENIAIEDNLTPPKTQSLEKPTQIILPKNTSVILPENTYLQTSDQTKIIMNPQTEVTLPVGTEISITKVNWYAILFYSLLVLGLAYYYLKGKTEDKDGDGYEDTKEKKEESKS
jgi:hypothetical protein